LSTPDEFGKEPEHHFKVPSILAAVQLAKVEPVIVSLGHIFAIKDAASVNAATWLHRLGSSITAKADKYGQPAQGSRHRLGRIVSINCIGRPH
jgi:hypothetical protein